MKERAWDLVAQSKAAHDLNINPGAESSKRFKNLSDTCVLIRREHSIKQPRSGSRAV